MPEPRNPDSHSDYFLSGALLSICSFVVLWLLYTVLIDVGMLLVGWISIFKASRYENTALVCGAAVGAVMAFLSLRILAGWITSRPR